MNPEAEIRQALSRALAALGIAHEAKDIPLEFPAELQHGDFASSVALAFAKHSGMKPRELADKLAHDLEDSIISVERVEVAGPGFINFYLKPESFAEVVHAIEKNPDEWGRGNAHSGEKIMVEYTDPNPFKEFHIGHLMSNAIGEAIARSLQFAGAQVKKVNYQGDIGPHVAKAVYILLRNKELVSDFVAPTVAQIGAAYTEGARLYEESTEAKQEIDQLNQHIYETVDAAKSGRSVPDRDLLIVYGKGRDISLLHFDDVYHLLGTYFDHSFFETDTAPVGKALVLAHPEVFEKSDTTWIYRGGKVGLHTRVFITREPYGTPTYEAKDLGLLRLKSELGPLDASITITATEQADYFKVMLAAAKELPEVRDIATKTKHVTHGMMRFAEGKMSSRKGNVITGESLLADLTDAAKERAAESRAADHEKLAQDIAVAAIKYQILKQASGKDIIFDRERALSLEGDSGPYLQYTHARAHQIVERAPAEGVTMRYDAEQSPIDLVRFLARFPHEAARAAAMLEPHLVATYLLELSAMFNHWYAEEKILDGTPLAAHKVAITDAVRATLKNGLWLLGIPAPEKM